MQAGIIDTHCHLNYPDFNNDRDGMMQRAEAAGVCGFLTVATTPDEWIRCLDLAEGRRTVRVALGVHPNDCALYSPQVARELKLLAAKDERVLAIGETGLDFFRDRGGRENQAAAFQSQLEIAAELNKPFILHCRAAEPEMLKQLAAHRATAGDTFRGVWHCFTSTLDYMNQAAAMGLYFGLGGVVTYPKAEGLREAVKAMPADKILLETDCPFLPPQPWRGQRNEPAYLTAVVEKIAAVRGATPDVIREQTHTNAQRLFNAWR